MAHTSFSRHSWFGAARRRAALRCALIALAASALAAPVPARPAAPAQASVVSPLYGQLMREFHTSREGLPSDDVRAVAVDDAGRVWAATAGGVARYDGARWRAYGAAEGLGESDVRLIAALGDSIWAAGAEKLYRLQGERLAEVAGAPRGPYRALRASAGRLVAAGETELGVFDGQRWEHAPYPEGAVARDAVADHEGAVWLAGEQGVWRWLGGEWKAYPVGGGHAGPAAAPTALALDAAGTLWVATTGGLSVGDRRGWWDYMTPEGGLPFEHITCIGAGAGVVWVGSATGSARLKAGDWDYFGNLRWLPADEVRGVAVAADGSAWLATPGGVSRIYEQLMTLEQKAAHFEERLQRRHYRRGYVAACGFEDPADPDTFIYDVNDNDGLWTGLYVGAQAYRWAATGRPEARAQARTSVMALIDLERKTGISGFPARAVVKRGEPRVGDAGGPRRQWHDSPDGEHRWLGDTSSDELCGHFYAYALYYDLVADDADKEEIRGICRRIMDHIIANGYLLVGPDGRHTTWGVWRPEMINGSWQRGHERGLNSLEILSFLKVTHHVTGDPKYQEHYLYLALQHHYALNTVYQKIVAPREVNHSDDELAILSYAGLLRYEQDPALRAIYLASLERTWRVERPERSPFQNFIYGAATGKGCDVEESVAALRSMPWDLRAYAMRNSHRADLRDDTARGRFRERQAERALKPHERGMMKWNGNPYQMDSGGDGTWEDDGAFFLLPYWMGRHYGFIKE